MDAWRFDYSWNSLREIFRTGVLLLSEFARYQPRDGISKITVYSDGEICNI